jgi:hypothetical protein
MESGSSGPQPQQQQVNVPRREEDALASALIRSIYDQGPQLAYDRSYHGPLAHERPSPPQQQQESSPIVQSLVQQPQQPVANVYDYDEEYLLTEGEDYEGEDEDDIEEGEVDDIAGVEYLEDFQREEDEEEEKEDPEDHHHQHSHYQAQQPTLGMKEGHRQFYPLPSIQIQRDEIHSVSSSSRRSHSRGDVRFAAKVSYSPYDDEFQSMTSVNCFVVFHLLSLINI